jgi:FkbM family methyltransferase
MLPRALIVSFEPARETFERLSNTLRDKPGFLLFNCALGEDDATLPMHCYSDTMTSSLLPMAELHKQAFPVAGAEGSEIVKVQRLDDALAGHSLEAEILVKIDVQGYEDKVIRGGEQLISRARAVVAEVSFQSLYEGQPLFDSIYSLMTERGLTYAGNLYQLFSPVDNSILQADALFIRR